MSKQYKFHQFLDWTEFKEDEKIKVEKKPRKLIK